MNKRNFQDICTIAQFKNFACFKYWNSTEQNSGQMKIYISICISAKGKEKLS